MVFTLRTSPFTSRWIHLYACNASYALRKTSFKQNWRKTTWKRINNFRFGSTAKVNYVILITDSETFKLKHFSAYFMLKRLESMLSIPQKLKKKSQKTQKILPKIFKNTSSKLIVISIKRFWSTWHRFNNSRDRNHDDFTAWIIMTTGFSCCIMADLNLRLIVPI